MLTANFEGSGLLTEGFNVIDTSGVTNNVASIAVVAVSDILGFSDDAYIDYSVNDGVEDSPIYRITILGLASDSSASCGECSPPSAVIVERLSLVIE